jgi:Na+/H+ antiporter NhaA
VGWSWPSQLTDLCRRCSGPSCSTPSARSPGWRRRAASCCSGPRCWRFALANSPWHREFERLWTTPVELRFGRLGFEASLRQVIDDGLMTIFFFVVGMEIKRELIEGELRKLRQALLPAIAAAGGVLLPGTIFFALNRGTPGEMGWAIPMATDIAFSIGCIVLLGSGCRGRCWCS